MDRALEARTLGDLDELLADLPAIDLYQLPDASLRRAPPHLGQSLLPADLGGHVPGQVRAGDGGHGRVGGGRRPRWSPSGRSPPWSAAAPGSPGGR